MRKILVTSILALSLMLSACGGGPSESEVENVFRQNAIGVFESTLGLIKDDPTVQAQLKRIKQMKITVDEISSGENDVYIATVTVEQDGHMRQERIRLKQGEKGWAIIH
uniref:DUF4878 domain-containing protein n=1 Tax=Candidatus Kentrum sp. UNK TaxID=2126344 RepID=A0A451B561_9GAMM|nr:MAG: hypothetical protein BECKUNK1418G_GA0071005_12032 [Candidatus Kentron sp. UNK]VFK73419.1 MAG: hypothetical protein BECKUNK1418H_GA0071006_11992 [Candidatus Kentron sp. UNK]